jgi:hypothetical protein
MKSGSNGPFVQACEKEGLKHLEGGGKSKVEYSSRIIEDQQNVDTV